METGAHRPEQARDVRNDELNEDASPIDLGGRMKNLGYVKADVADSPFPPLRLEIVNDDGHNLRRFAADGKFEAWIMFSGVQLHSGAEAIDRAHTARVVSVLQFPNADIGQHQLDRIQHAVGSLNAALADAHASINEPTPDAASCHHKIRIERFGRMLSAQATCERCLTVLVPDVKKWLEEHDYYPEMEPSTASAIIEEIANRGR